MSGCPLFPVDERRRSALVPAMEAWMLFSSLGSVRNTMVF